MLSVVCFVSVELLFAHELNAGSCLVIGTVCFAHGTLESGDIMIQIAPAETKGLHIDLDSSVAAQFGRQIRQVIEETLTEFGLEDADIKAVDKGARDCTIRARVTAAITDILRPALP